jgi:hypothetical protein
MADQQMYVVGFAVELDQLGSEYAADLSEGGLAVGEHGVVEESPAVFGHEDQVGVQERNRVAGVPLMLRLRQVCRSSCLAWVA